MAPSDSVPPDHFYGQPPKTPSRTTVQPVHETPLSARLPSTQPLTSTAVFRDKVFVAAANEMKGKFVGPIHPRAFFATYLSVQTPALPTVDYSALRKVAKIDKETDMYDPLIKALNPFCNGLELFNTSGKDDPKSGVFFNRNIKPDISAYKQGVIPPGDEDITRARDMVTYMELKTQPVDEPFNDKEGEAFEHDTECSRDTRGQLTLYANAIQATQFRTHAITIFINRSKCRFIHWTRSCAVVTEAFDYTKVDWLPRFLWCLSHADDDKRGIDTTFVPVTDSEESGDARHALDLNVDDPLYKVSVHDDATEATSYYIVSRAFTRNHIHPIGRGTRCFMAYDCQSGKIVLLKDTWRVKDYMKEGDVYRELREKKVEKIAGLLASGDIHGVNHTSGVASTLVPHLPPRRIHIHYRLVLDTVGSSITCFSSTWQMVRAVSDALRAHRDAVTKAGILHRDISVGNVLIVPAGGILIDWELCRRLDEPNTPRALERTGTWQFISVRLLTGDQKTHSVGDDLESFLYVLAWVAARYAPNRMSEKRRTYFVRNYDYTQANEDGYAKQSVLRGGRATIIDLKIDQLPFQQLLGDLWTAFACRYQSETYSLELQRDPVAAQRLLDRLESHDWMIEQLCEALRDNTWHAARDASVRHPIIETNESLTAGQLKRKSQMLSHYPELAQIRDGLIEEGSDEESKPHFKRQKMGVVEVDAP